jgi:hypothetical protein
MRKIRKIFPFGLVAVLLASCADKLITNLTPSAQPRNPTGQYLVEMKLDSSQQTLRPESITPYVVIGFNEYKMRPTLKMANRWETYVPVLADKDSVLYFFKVDYEYNKFGGSGKGSMRSTEYKLDIK